MRLALVLVLACGGAAPPPPMSNRAAVQAAPDERPTCTEHTHRCRADFVAYFARRACACKDRPCVEQVASEFTEWGRQVSAHDLTKPISEPPDEQLVKRTTADAGAYSDCYTQRVVDDANRP